VLDETDAVLAELDRLLALWDAAQAEGDLREAERLQAELTRRVDASFDLLVAVARGARGQAGVYVGTMALGFAPASRPATEVLVERLREQDPRLVANALIALKLRADPQTALRPLVTHLASASADVRRYAPLALARVLEARRVAGLPADGALEAEALRRLASQTRDGDALVRLHTAKVLGELRLPAAVDVLLGMLDDTSERVRLGAAAALARHGSRPGFERTVHLMHEMRPEAQPLMAAVLVTHAERLQGRPLSPEEIRALGASAPAWARWYADFVQRESAAPAAPPRATTGGGRP
jgi:HEAT repeat protein